MILSEKKKAQDKPKIMSVIHPKRKRSPKKKQRIKDKRLKSMVMLMIR